MQLLPDHQALLASVKDLGQSMFESSDMEVKEKRSSNASLLLMNPVASGDNVATGLASAHKLKEELPPLVPCCEGRELQITEDLARSGLSAISVRHDSSVVQSLSSSRACDKLQVAPGLVKHRNSFRCLHRPDLKRVPYLRRMSPDELEMLFRGYADFPSCASRSESQEENLRARLTSEENIRIKDLRTKDNGGPDDVSGLHPIPEMHSGAEDLPAGMRLHGARARLYTSVLAGAKAGDQLDGESLHEDTIQRDQEDILVPDEEVVLHEELQIILPPRCDDVTNASTPSTTLTENSLDSQPPNL